MTAAAVLAEVRSRGARAFRRGDKLRLEPFEALTPDLIARARAVRDELLALVSEPPPETTEPTSTDRAFGGGRCPADTASHPGGVEHGAGAACGTCDHSRRAPCGGPPSRWVSATCHPPARGLAVEREVGNRTPRYPLAIAAEPLGPNVPAERRSAIDADLALLRTIVERYALVWSDDTEIATATVLGERIDELLERLAAAGLEVRVVPLS